MSHFAKINNQGIVEQVIVAEQDFIDTLEGTWIQTSYNTRGGVHILGGSPLRKNFAGIGDTYDAARDAFIAPKPYPSWVLNEDTCQWNAPVSMPADGYLWDEESQSWKAPELATPVETLP
jgi:hypothetical protein